MGQANTTAVRLFLLGQPRIFDHRDGGSELPIQPKPMHLLAFLALYWNQAHRRESLQARFWPDKAPRAAANNLRQTLWHLRKTLPAGLLEVQGDTVRWNPAEPPWVDALAFASSVESGDLDEALDLYGGALLPDC